MSTNSGRDKENIIYPSMEFYLPVKGNEVLVRARTSRNLGNMQTERNHTQKTFSVQFDLYKIS